jgi:Ca2+-binding RTX toxin-like protein
LAQTAYEQYMLELINLARLDPAAAAALYGVSLGSISASSKQPLAGNQLLTNAAEDHGAWMLDTDTFSHAGAGGSDPGDRMRDAGYVFTGSWSWGENLSWRGTTGTLDVVSAIDAMHASLFQSSGHRANILNDTFQEVGVGIVTGEMTSNGKDFNAAMVTQDFARSGSGAFITGVAYTDTDGNDFYSVGEGRGGVLVSMERVGGSTTTTTTDAPGGYEGKLSAGTYNVVFSGGGLPAMLGMTVALGSRNIKLDLIGTTAIASSASLIMGINLIGLTLLGTENLTATGNALANLIEGNKGANQIDGGGGGDTLSGGAGNDVFVLKAGQADGDVIGDFAGNGAAAGDSIQFDGYNAGATLTSLGGGQWQIVDGSKTETFTVTGAIAAGDYSFVNVGAPPPPPPPDPGAGDDTVAGTGDADSLSGGGGNDQIGGLAGIDTLDGGAGSDTLDGGTGADRLVGGAANDTYVVDNAGDVVDESGGGIDTIQTIFSADLGAGSLTGIEDALLLGTSAINAYGNATGNQLTGNGAANILDGRGGTDTLAGGKGNDTYVVDSAADVVIEVASGGTDTVTSSASFTLADGNLEHLTLLAGAGAINGTGNALANKLTGNESANLLDGRAGADTLVGGLGDDVYVVDVSGDVVTESSGAGSDTIRTTLAGYTLGANLDNLVLLAGAVSGTGNALANVLTGNDAANTLDGKAGADKLVGGNGNDVYIVDVAGDLVVESGADSADEIRSAVALGAVVAGVEHYAFTGTAAVNFGGDDDANRIAGTAAADTLSGGAGADTLIGGAGNDSLAGGTGDDTYVVTSAKDKVNESTGGGADVDTIESSLAYSLVANGTTLTGNVENLTLTGTSAVSGTGNALDNLIRGNTAANTLTGNAGDDTLIGGAGNDKLVGGADDDRIDVSLGNDTVRYTSSLDGTDIVDGFDGNAAGGQDVFNLDAFFDSLGIAAAARTARVFASDKGSSVEVQFDADVNGTFETVLATLNTADVITVGSDIVLGT